MIFGMREDERAVPTGVTSVTSAIVTTDVKTPVLSTPPPSTGETKPPADDPAAVVLLLANAISISLERARLVAGVSERRDRGNADLLEDPYSFPFSRPRARASIVCAARALGYQALAAL